MKVVGSHGRYCFRYVSKFSALKKKFAGFLEFTTPSEFQKIWQNSMSFLKFKSYWRGCRLMQIKCCMPAKFLLKNQTYWWLPFGTLLMTMVNRPVWRCVSYWPWRFSTMLPEGHSPQPEVQRFFTRSQRGFSRGVIFKELKSVFKTSSILSTSRLESSFGEKIDRWSIFIWSTFIGQKFGCSLGDVRGPHLVWHMRILGSRHF